MLVPVVLNVFVLVLMAPWDGCNLHHAVAQCIVSCLQPGDVACHMIFLFCLLHDSIHTVPF